MIILKILGSALTLYGVYGMLSGEVYAKQGITSRFIYKSEEPVYFWSVCAGYIIGGCLIMGALFYKYG